MDVGWTEWPSVRLYCPGLFLGWASFCIRLCSWISTVYLWGFLAFFLWRFFLIFSASCDFKCSMLETKQWRVDKRYVWQTHGVSAVRKWRGRSWKPMMRKSITGFVVKITEESMQGGGWEDITITTCFSWHAYFTVVCCGTGWQQVYHSDINRGQFYEFWRPWVNFQWRRYPPYSAIMIFYEDFQQLPVTKSHILMVVKQMCSF